MSKLQYIPVSRYSIAVRTTHTHTCWGRCQIRRGEQDACQENLVKPKILVLAPCPRPWPSCLTAGAEGMQYLVKGITKNGHLNFGIVCLTKAISCIINTKPYILFKAPRGEAVAH